jgi:hypothetical protein
MIGNAPPRILLILLLLTVMVPLNAETQTLKVAAGNTLIGTANGALLGLSYMGLSNEANLAPVRFGVGAGTLYGMGIGLSDAIEYDRMGFYSIEGLFNTTEYTSLIVLFDTFYGGATGGVLGMAIGLMVNAHVGEFLRYGASTGAFAGFAFGLFDAFYLNREQGLDFDSKSVALNHQHVDGFLRLEGLPTDIQLGLFSAELQSKPAYVQSSGKTILASTADVHFRLFHMKVPF